MQITQVGSNLASHELKKSLPRRSPSVLTGAAFIRTRGSPSGAFVLSCYFFHTHIAMHVGVLLQNKSCPSCRYALVPTMSKVEAIDTCPSQGEVRGSGKYRLGIGVCFFRRPANSRMLLSVITTACCKRYRLGIAHTRLPMKEHLGQPKIVTVLRGRPGNYGHIKAIVAAIVRALL